MLSGKIEESSRNGSFAGYPKGKFALDGKNYAYDASRMRCATPEDGVALKFVVYELNADGSRGDGVVAVIDGYEKAVELPQPDSARVLHTALDAALAQFGK